MSHTMHFEAVPVKPRARRRQRSFPSPAPLVATARPGCPARGSGRGPGRGSKPMPATCRQCAETGAAALPVTGPARRSGRGPGRGSKPMPGEIAFKVNPPTSAFFPRRDSFSGTRGAAPLKKCCPPFPESRRKN